MTVLHLTLILPQSVYRRYLFWCRNLLIFKSRGRTETTCYPQLKIYISNKTTNHVRHFFKLHYSSNKVFSASYLWEWITLSKITLSKIIKLIEKSVVDHFVKSDMPYVISKILLMRWSFAIFYNVSFDKVTPWRI